MKNILIAILILFLAGCATGHLVHFSEDALTIKWEGIQSSPERVQAMAQNQCGKYGKNAVLLEDISGLGQHLSSFKCVSSKTEKPSGNVSSLSVPPEYK
jgi:hypothetical protein